MKGEIFINLKPWFFSKVLLKRWGGGLKKRHKSFEASMFFGGGKTSISKVPSLGRIHKGNPLKLHIPGASDFFFSVQVWGGKI